MEGFNSCSNATTVSSETDEKNWGYFHDDSDRCNRCVGFLIFFVKFLKWGGVGGGQGLKESVFLLKYRSYCKTLTVKTHQYNWILYTVAKDSQALQCNGEFAWRKVDKSPIHLPCLERKHTNHTARIWISETFLNKLSIGQLAQLLYNISRFIFSQRCWFLCLMLTCPSLPLPPKYKDK